MVQVFFMISCEKVCKIKLSKKIRLYATPKGSIEDHLKEGL